MSLLQTLEEVLCQHVSAINARVVVERSRRVLTDPLLRTREERARFLAAVRSTLRLFTSDEKAAAIIADVDRRLVPTGMRVDQERVTYEIVHEDDLRAARAGVRELCLSFSASSGDAQRMATAVSELARNIISYTPGGEIELEIHRGPPLKLTIIAQDRGPGIANVALILSGGYRSKTGLGRGLLGVKKLMKEFRILTSPSGTRIEAEVTLS